MRWILSLVLIGLWGKAQEVKPYLRIETGSHTAKVTKIDVDAAEQYLVSVSNDKTARVRNLKTGKLLRVLRPPIGDFEQGKLYAVSISTDGSSVAVGGFTGAAGSGAYPIYILNTETGTIRRRIPGLPEVTYHLAYSRDGRYLAAALGGSNGIRIFETSGYSEVARDTSYGDSSYWIEFNQSGRLVTTSDDGFVRLYGSDFKLITRTKPNGGKLPFSARFSPDGKRIALGLDARAAVDVLSAKDLKFQYELTRGQSEDLSSVAWSADGMRLCGAGRYNLRGLLPVVCWIGRENKTATELPAAGNTITDLRALRDGSLAFSAADGTVAVLAPNGVDRWRATPDQLAFRTGAPALLLSPDAASVEVPARYFASNTWTRLNLFFSASDRTLEKNGASHTSFLNPSTEGLQVASWQKEFPTLNGRALELEQHERSRSLAISSTKDTFVLGTEWYIRHFDRQGKELWNTPVPGVAWAINISSDKKYVVAALGDGTLRWYTLDKGQEVLALFVDHTATKWVAWNPDGFFAFDGGGDAFIGYHLNRGPGEAGEFIKVDQLREVFYRPDLISQILKPEGAKAVLEARNKIGDLSAILAGGSPPEVELLSPTTADVTDDYRLEFRIKDQGRGHGRVVYRIDGAEIEGKQVDIKGTARDTVSARIPVGSGDHRVEVAVFNAKGTIQGPPQTIQLSKRQPSAQASLYVVAAGVSHYRDHSLDTGVKFAAADADLVAARFHEQEGKGLYRRVSTVSLVDRQATIKNIQAEVAKVAKAIQPGDTFVLYLSGHGRAVDGEYYFIPWEAEYPNEAELLKASLNREAIQSLLKVPTNKTVLMLDTCGAGGFLEGRSTGTEKAAMEKIAKMSGRAVLAASNTDQMALDGYQNHGAFTYVLLQGLSDAQDNGRGEISIFDLAKFVQSRVPDITEQKWHYRQTPLSKFDGEPFPIVHK